MLPHITAVCLLICSQYIVATETLNCNVPDKHNLPNDVCTFDLRMKGAQPKKNDEYLCSGYKVSNDVLGTPDQPNVDGYIVRYQALADAGLVHHILVFGCKRLSRNLDQPWHCGQVCDGDDQIIFAWAKNAPELSLPPDVGQHVGGSTGINYIVLQIHYKSPLPAPDSSGIRLYTTKQRQKYISGIFLLLAYGIIIPADTPKFHMNSSCRFNWGPGISIHPIGYRTHAHSLCTVISGYKEHNGKYELIGKGNPQWPQAFYPVDKPVTINPGDVLAAQCTYNSTGRHRGTQIGSTGEDEMCNFYIMYYMDSAMENLRGKDTCYKNSEAAVFWNLPADSDVPLPPNPALEGAAGSHHHHAMGGSNEDHDNHGKVDEPQVDVEKPQVNFHGNSPSAVNPGNGMLNRGYGSQGKFSTSLGDSVLNDVYRSGDQGYRSKGFQFSGLETGRPSSYFMDYPGLDDYYNDVIQQRSRNRLRKPAYDLYDSSNYDVDFSEFPKKSYSTLSRNRNKLFNDKYDEYAATAFSGSRGSKGKEFSAVSENKSQNTVSKVAQKQNKTAEGLPKTEVKLNKDLDLQFVSEVTNIEIGQVGGLAVNQAGDLYIFHRGNNIWSQLSFNVYEVYTQKNVPVDVDAVIVLDKNGKLKRHFGKKRYFLPHGLSLDSEENIWLTDVALHQVFRIPHGKKEPDMTLGMRFEPGTDKDHFCKPSDVAVLSTGEFFVSDGYCNFRVMKFDKNGYFVKQWGTRSASFGSDGFPPPGTFNLPHGLALAEDKNLLCVADRENGRIQCFDLNGQFVRQMHPKQFGESLYAVEYCPNHGGVLFAVNGPLFGSSSKTTQGFTLDINTGTLVSMWNTPGEGLTHPHDVTVDSVNHVVYVGELNPSKVWKFQMADAFYSTNKSSNKTKVTGESKKPVAMAGTKSGVSVETSTISVVAITPTKSTPIIDVVNSDSDVVSNVNTYNEDLVDNKGTDGVQDGVKNSDNLNSDTVVLIQYKKVEDSESVAPSVIIGTLLVVPVLLLVIITIIVRLHHSGYFKSCRRGSRKKVFSLGNFLHSHKGFDRLSTEDDDHDYDNVLDDDSDNEEFNIVRKA